MIINKYLSLITLNTGDLNSPMKRQINRFNLKAGSTLSCFQEETHINIKDGHKLVVMEWKKIFQAHRSKKQEGISILILEKIDFKLKLLRRHRKGKLHTHQGKEPPRGKRHSYQLFTKHKGTKFIKETLLYSLN